LSPPAGYAQVRGLKAKSQGRIVMSRQSQLQPPALDVESVAPVTGSGYPEPFRDAVAGREKRRLSDALGLSHFGVNLVRLAPGVTSSLRHWHTAEDEFIYVLEGEVELITDAGPQTLRPGMAAGFPAGRADGHHLVNRSGRDVVYLEVGDRQEHVDEVEYPDVDLRLVGRNGRRIFVRRDGTAW
jgi:uncharacterized cupin superfamily protein